MWMLLLMLAHALKDQCQGVYAPLVTKKADLIQSYFRGGKRGCLVLAVETDVLKKKKKKTTHTMIWAYFQRQHF